MTDNLFDTRIAPSEYDKFSNTVEGAKVLRDEEAFWVYLELF